MTDTQEFAKYVQTGGYGGAGVCNAGNAEKKSADSVNARLGRIFPPAHAEHSFCSGLPKRQFLPPCKIAEGLAPQLF
ncbi:hypothetical protein [Desulfovibrio desulfuricans]|uniref:hypothetical protein n=1 Tax=Desulfovibrio desulfuricans TaxID=876 RepID=UPI001C009BBF|nr:hypothetical protein [Desulfovibrio desulfuricans]MBT9748557.1 hypothetical protein [Desulfovibrio desulfuricans]